LHCGIFAAGFVSRGATEALSGANFCGELFVFFAKGPEIALDLQPVPELGGLAEEGTEADGHDGSNRSVAEHDLVDRARGDSDSAGHGVLRNSHRREVFLEQDFTGCNRRVHGYNV